VADAIRITDLADPQLPEAIRHMNAVPEAEARRQLPLDEAALLGEARAETGLDDFGDDQFREGLGVLIRALDDEAHLGLLGRVAAKTQIVRLLANRLRICDVARRSPGVLEQPVERPLVVVGLPRTGTTHLHNLLAEHPDLRFLPYWESEEPVLAASERAATGEPDPRIARAAAGLAQIDAVMPLFRAMHEMTAEGPHEEIALLAMEFATPLFDAQYHVPSYHRWYRSVDQTRSYRWLYRCLQVLQRLRDGGKRWVLKSPQHLAQLGPLVRTFPDARIVLTHRDPVRVIASMATMLAYSARMNARSVDPVAIGRESAGKIVEWLRAAVRDRHLVPDDQVFAVRFPEFMRDEITMVARVLAFAGLRADGTILDRLRRFQTENARGKFGRIEYRFEDVGLSPETLRADVREYQTFFGVEDE
jgi:hypothetical protein